MSTATKPAFDSGHIDRQVFKIGDKEFKRRRQNWEAARLLSAKQREQSKLQRAFEKSLKAVDDAVDADESEAKIKAAEDKAAKDEEALLLWGYEFVTQMLRDDDGKSPDIELIKAEVDINDIGRLAELLGSGEPDPTTAPTAESTSTS